MFGASYRVRRVLNARQIMSGSNGAVGEPCRERGQRRNALFDARFWTLKLHHYAESHALRAAGELTITLVPFAIAWFLMLLALENGYLWIYALLLLPTTGLLVRLFMIQHDCGHGSFVGSRWANDWIGRALGVLTLTPYHTWRRGHAIHHASAGSLDRRGVGDVNTLTVAEYLALSRWGRLRYRLYRHPGVMFGLGPVYLFVLRNRVPIGLMRAGWKPWVSTMATNLALATSIGFVISVVGLEQFLLIQVPVVLLGGVAGIWLFYVQHQFSETFWARSESWNMRYAALHGSSYYDLPAVLRWFTANIGVHHVHHLSSRIPFYRLPQVLRDYPELSHVGRITLRQSLNGLSLVLWDEERERLISLRDLPAGVT
jgi:omega-6 fatty acid desaturase (delta-12 desaturase)